MMGGNPITFDYTLVLHLHLLLSLGLFAFVVAFVVYFMVSTLRFFKRKTQNDKELLVKLDELIKLQTHQSEKPSAKL
ncbi:hypothetical protein [Desulfosporosinus sp. FKA]|uniref:hypothetical protein n=1 Tax=Desulfosporosinus sp. FKA TaxID=1969834 RepID=UPI0032B833ED